MANNHKPPAARLAPLVVTPMDACALLAVSLDRVYQLIRTGELDSYLDGERRRRITTASIHTYLARQLRAQNRGRGNEPTRYARSPRSRSRPQAAEQATNSR
jgi:excisionase family DNA binding protein